MNLLNLRFLTDENIDIEVLYFLREQGFDVFDIKEEALFQMADAAILALFYEQNRVVISQDSDFGTLIFRDAALFYGIIYLRPGHVSPIVHIQTLKQIISTHFEVQIPFMIVGENNGDLIKIRIRSF